MSKVRFELNSQGVQALLKGAEMQAILKGYGEQKASAAGDGYSSEVHVFQKRAVAHVFPDTPEAARDNLKNNTLLKVR